MKHSLFDGIPPSLPEELTETLFRNSRTRIERIVSRGHRSEDGFWYDQDENEFVLLMSGEATLLFDQPSEEITLRAGDWILIPAGRKHRVEQTSSDQACIWLAVFLEALTKPDADLAE